MEPVSSVEQELNPMTAGLSARAAASNSSIRIGPVSDGMPPPRRAGTHRARPPVWPPGTPLPRPLQELWAYGQDPRPTPDSIAAYYPSAYGPHQDREVHALGGDRVRPGWRAAIRHRFDFRAQALPPVVPGHALEVGCAVGTFLNRLRARGWTVEGLESSEAAAERAGGKGHHVETTKIEEAGFRGEKPYDLIVAWMVLEICTTLSARCRSCRPGRIPRDGLRYLSQMLQPSNSRSSWIVGMTWTFQDTFSISHLRRSARFWSRADGMWRESCTNVYSRTVSAAWNSYYTDAKWCSALAPRLGRLRQSRITNFRALPIGDTIGTLRSDRTNSGMGSSDQIEVLLRMSGRVVESTR